MPIVWSDGFGRSGHALLDSTAYPAIFGGSQPRCFGSGDAATVVRMCTDTGFRSGEAMASPNYALETTFNIDTAGGVNALWFLGRYQAVGNANYAVAISFSDDATNVHPQDGADPPVLADGYVYLFRYNGDTDGNAVLIGSAVAHTITSGADHRARLVLYGNRISFYVDGIEYITESDSYWLDNNWNFGSYGLGLTVITGGNSTTGVVDFDDLQVGLIDTFIDAAAAHDENRRLVRFSLPSAGSGGMTQIYNYHLDTGDWTIEDLETRELASVLDARGDQRVVYSDPSDSKVYQIDDTAARGSTAIDGEWVSNWIELSPPEMPEVLVDSLRADLELDAGLSAELYAEVARDLADPRTWSRRNFVGGLAGNQAIAINRAGHYCRIGIRHAGATGSLKLRRLTLGVQAG